ncbi:MAG: type I-U CRISPR-associated helicase/endonuclease Cas3 [Candidatus Nanopelagicales bacterium]|nr:type I-U CRISPR-associated helicase/endonuclease Cas3 [Candidatus Nanopelagicales bacterium]
MTGLVRDDFATFFAAAHGDSRRRPFAWQERLLDQVLTGEWPRQIAAPTGAGKTAVIDVHVFAVALMGADVLDVRVPRRLALVVNRRGLVDDQFEHARRLQGLLANPGGCVLSQVADALGALRWASRPGEARSPLVVGRLRGSLPPSRGWRDDPTACAVLCATPDMWGSRLLLRGYGSAPAAWPREAGLLAHDAVVVIDEAHLSRQLLTSARRVAVLHAAAPRSIPGPPLQVVETTATPTGSAKSVVAVTDHDLRADSVLARRLSLPKPVRRLTLPSWPLSGKRGRAARAKAVPLLADQACELREKFGPTVGCFVNNVASAVDLADELRQRQREGRGLVVELFCGRMREHDVQQARLRYPGLLEPRGNTAVDVVVATQTLEVGVDVDFTAAVTEIASGTAIAQRAGRVNRMGDRQTTEIVLAGPETAAPDVQAWPYVGTDISAASDWIERRARDSFGLAPAALHLDPPPQQALKRLLLQRPELADSWHWARTSDVLAAEPELDLWLDDDLDPDLDVGIITRRALPSDPVDATRLVRCLPPRQHEVFPTTMRIANTLRSRLAEQATPVLLARAGQVDVLADDDRLRPGDILVVDDRIPIQRANVIDADTGDLTGAPDVLTVGGGSSEVGEIVLRVEPGLGLAVSNDRIAEALEACADALAEGATHKARQRVADILDVALSADTAAEATWLLRHRVSDCDVHLHTNPDGTPTRLLLIDARRAVRDDEERQVRSVTGEPVLLSTHAAAVRDRACQLGQLLIPDTGLTNALAAAGQHHDDGKTDPRFQGILGADAPGDQPLAKSGSRSRSAAKNNVGLPSGWRHEQLSVVKAAGQVDAHEQELVLRLVGTSHGQGRHGFPHTTTDLVHSNKTESLVELSQAFFDEGTWDDLIEATHLAWGVWGCAYLEALLRAADCQVSAEGS